ncbi:MAG: cysteine dioxygenase family protein [Candidatus Binatia bacterium]
MVGNISKLHALLTYLDGLRERASELMLGRLLRELEITVADVERFVRFDEHQYCRNLMRGSDHYQALLLCWRSGQRTPIHNHPGAVGGVRTLKGIATETLFEFAPNGLVKPTCSRDLEPGGVVTLENPYIHQVSNLQEAGEDLVTLHVYSPPLPRMDTYCLTDRHVGEYRPSVVEHELGSGI